MANLPFNLASSGSVFTRMSASQICRPQLAALARLAGGFLLASGSFLVGCSDHGGYIDAVADVRLEIPSSIASDIEYPTLVSFGIGYEGKEMNNSSASEQVRLIFCEPLDPFVYPQQVELHAPCKREDFYVRVTLQAVSLDDPNACDDADPDGVLVVGSSDYTAANRVLADNRQLGWSEKDCGNQYKEFDMTLEELD